MNRIIIISGADDTGKTTAVSRLVKALFEDEEIAFATANDTKLAWIQALKHCTKCLIVDDLISKEAIKGAADYLQGFLSEAKVDCRLIFITNTTEDLLDLPKQRFKLHYSLRIDYPNFKK